MNRNNILRMVDGYIDAVLFTTYEDDVDGAGEIYLDENYNKNDFAQETIIKITCDCMEFLERAKFETLIDNANFYQAGIDFLLTRNGHGTGFWDREEEWGIFKDHLSECASSFPSVDYYIGDNGKIYGE